MVLPATSKLRLFLRLDFIRRVCFLLIIASRFPTLINF